LCSSHRAGLAFVNSLALHQDFSYQLDGSLGAALGFPTKAIESARLCLLREKMIKFLQDNYPRCLPTRAPVRDGTG
jgi:hypothetical protein